MTIDEVDWRIGPLEHAVVGIDAGLAAIYGELHACKDVKLLLGGYDGLHACEDAEPLLGLGFVAFQTYALGTVEDLIRIRATRGKPKITKKSDFKHYCYSCDPIIVKGNVTRIQLIIAIADYFKHHDEWSTWPTSKDDRGFEDAQILACVSITQRTEFPCIEAANMLCGTSWKMIVLHQIVREWRAHLINELG
jgi:hypothetical protein